MKNCVVNFVAENKTNLPTQALKKLMYVLRCIPHRALSPGRGLSYGSIRGCHRTGGSGDRQTVCGFTGRLCGRYMRIWQFCWGGLKVAPPSGNGIQTLPRPSQTCCVRVFQGVMRFCCRATWLSAATQSESATDGTAPTVRGLMELSQNHGPLDVLALTKRRSGRNWCCVHYR
jgi:hypothetical protein